MHSYIYQHPDEIEHLVVQSVSNLIFVLRRINSLRTAIYAFLPVRAFVSIRLFYAAVSGFIMKSR